MCHPPTFPAGSVMIVGLRTDSIPSHTHERLNERLGVVETILSDLIPLQPGESGYEPPEPALS